MMKDKIPENILFGIKNKNKFKKYCLRGHKYDIITCQGNRGCQQCLRIWQDKNNKKNIKKREEESKKKFWVGNYAR